MQVEIYEKIMNGSMNGCENMQNCLEQRELTRLVKMQEMQWARMLRRAGSEMK